MRKIYLASSWRNPYYLDALDRLRDAGHSVYDFRENSFQWHQLPDYLGNASTPKQLVEGLRHPTSTEHFALDYGAMQWADTGVLLMPAGRSAHLEAGWLAGRGKETFVVLHEDKFEPELMYLLNSHIVLSMDELMEVL